MKRTKLVIEARLDDCKGDMSKQWFVYYSVLNPLSNRMQRIKVYKGLSGPTADGRYHAAALVVDQLNAKLRAGWNPLVDKPGVIYADQLQYQHLAEKHNLKKRGNRTFNLFANIYLDHIRLLKRSAATITTYKSKFRHFDMWLQKHHIADNDIAAITSNDFECFIAYMQRDRGIGQNHTAEFTILFRSFGRWLVKKKELIVSPFDELKVQKVRGIASRSYNDWQIERMREVILPREPQLWLAIKFIFYCFTRPKELRLLRIRDIDFAGSRLTIAADVAKNNKTRIVDIPLYLLRELIDKGWHLMPGDWFLVGKEGLPSTKQVGKNYLGRHFKKYHRELGFAPEQKFYGIKHTGVMNMIKLDVDWLELKNQLGHHSLDQVMTYGQELMGTSSEKIRTVAKEI